MKTSLAFATLVLFIAALLIPQTSCSLKEDLHDFVELLPKDELAELAFHYFTVDQEFEDAFIYLKGEEFSVVWDEFFGVQVVKDVLNYLQDAGLNVYGVLNMIADHLEKNHVYPTVMKGKFREGGISGFTNEVLSMLPTEELKAMFEEKMRTSDDFRDFYDKLHHADFHKLLELYNSCEEVQSFLQKLRDHGIDVDSIFSIIAGIFGWAMI
ncbi:protein G12-like [Armigeres subalbatus]|uniref:protein G12-like n=1 Tax=Armigeres subalbatus TaxID=124917 RepID=UPI002ED1E42E